MDAPENTQPNQPTPANQPPYQPPKAGGKAKASKGKGRAPAVKGQQRVGKRRQSR
jgi:hypothetical protein